MSKSSVYNKNDELRLHRELADVYLQKHTTPYCRCYYDHWNEYLLNILPITSTGNILEIGAGVGVLTEELIKRFDNVLGLDISVDMLRVALRRAVPAGKLLVGDGESLPFTDGSFDAVVCRGALHHIPSLEKVLSEISRVLKPAGYLLACETCDDGLISRSIRNSYLRAYTKFSDKIEYDHPSLRSQELLPAVERSGLEINRVLRYGYMAYPLASMPEHVPVMKFIPFNVLLTRALIKIDGWLARLPLIRSQAWAITVLARKPAEF